MHNDRANNFDALRLIGALLVLYSHQFALLGHEEPLIHVETNTSFGALGVFIFFAISGYLVCRSWLADPDAQRFMQRRFLRIWPAMAVVIVVTSVLLFLTTPVGVWPLASYLTNLWCLGCSMGGSFFPGQPHTALYGSMWTLPLEVQCYALLLVAGMLCRQHLATFITYLAGAAMLSPLAREIVPAEVLTGLELNGWRWPSAGKYGALFLAGCVICVHPVLRDRPWLPVIGGAALIARGHFTIGMIFALPAVVIWVGSRSWPVLRGAGRFGDLSYGIYLWAWPVQQVLVMTLGRSVPVWAHMALALLLTLLLALASWHLIERPALRLKPGTRITEAVPGGTPAPAALPRG